MSEWFERFGFAEVADGLLTGAYPVDADDVAAIAAAEADVLYNLCEESEYAAGERDAVDAALSEHGLRERRMPLVDYGGIDAGDLERAVVEVISELEDGRRVYLHCRAGWHRSATVAAGVVALRHGLDIDSALTLLRDRRPSAEPLAHQRADLEAWYAERDA